MSSQHVSTLAVSNTVSRALFSSPNVHNDSPLCFNKAYFSQADFNVDRFVNLARRRANLSQIQNDLRVYLKIVQNSMIELINDDYADFVNLSSSLVGLKDTIDKLARDIESIWEDFCGSTKKLMTTAEFIEKQAADLSACRTRQLELRCNIAFINAVERVSSCISTEPEVISSLWLSHFTDGVVDLVTWYRKLPAYLNSKWSLAFDACVLRTRAVCERLLVSDLQGECRFARLFLGLLSLVDGVELAVSRVMNEVIEPETQFQSNDLAALLNHVLERILEIRGSWMTKLETWSGRTVAISAFLDKCLLTYIVSILDQHFGSVLVPSDRSLFHKCYSIICSFISNWPEPQRSRTVLRMIRDRFNILVYFKLETRQFLSDFTEWSDPSKLIMNEKDFGDSTNTFWFRCSTIVNDALNAVWSDLSFLPSLIDKYWDFSTRMLTNYLEWLDAIHRYFEVDHKEIKGIETWRLLCALCADCSSLDNCVFSLALSSIWSKIRDFELDTTLYGQCLTMFSTIMAKQRKEIEKIISDHIISVLCKVFDGVGDIPRHYRWTKKPPPTESSQYIIDAFGKFEEFRAEARMRGWNDEEIAGLSLGIISKACDVFCCKAEQVIESVEQTGTSLQRFKRKGAFLNSAESSPADSDENKIRSQLCLDVSYFKTQAEVFDLDFSRLDALISRASNALATQKPETLHSTSDANTSAL